MHAIDTHLFALLDLAERERVPRVAIQAMLDGRDTMPRSGLGYLEELLATARGRATVASVGGRYFGMDRDHRWERTEKWYRAAVLGAGPTATDPLALVREAYERGETDEFLAPDRDRGRRRRAGGADARRRRRDLLQLPVGPDAADRARARRSRLRRLRPWRARPT